MVNVLKGIAQKLSPYHGSNAYDIGKDLEERIREVFAANYINESGADLHGVLSGIDSPEFARYMDREDPLKDLRKEFHLPRWHVKKTGNDFLDAASNFFHKLGIDIWNKTVDFRGNSLGAQPKNAKKFVNKELDIWAQEGHEGHFAQSDAEDRLPRWIYHENFQDGLAELLGCKPDEAIQMGTLSANNINLLERFYYMAKRNGKSKIMVEQGPFPSDFDNVRYVVTMQNGIDSKDADNHIVTIPKREDGLIHTEDIINLIEEHKEELGVIFLGAINYYTGQLLDIPAITKAAQKYGIYVGFDLAHAFGNVPLDLHEDGVDFAASCSYKYANSGPGGPGIAYVHRKNHDLDGINLAAGRWARHKKSRFTFDSQNPSEYTPADGIRRILISNDAINHQAPLLASLEVFKKTTPGQLRHKSLLLTGYLEYLLDTVIGSKYIQIITPREPAQRGAQISFRITSPKFTGENVPHQVEVALHKLGFGIEPRDDIVRISPAPLYNTFSEVRDIVHALHSILV